MPGKRILVFQHIDVEHPGVFRDFLAEDGIALDAIELDAGEPIPPLDGYSALWVMGGPMDVWEEEEYPWLVPEKRAIHEWVAVRRMPFLGVCLGHQLLGDALGGRVGKMPAPEVGILDVRLTDAARSDPVFAGLQPTTPCLQWHGAAVLEAPPGATVLAESPLCAVQAMRVGDRAYGIQYHVEITAQTVQDWGRVPAYGEALDRAMGSGSLQRLDAQTRASLPAFNRDARSLYQSFMAMVR